MRLSHTSLPTVGAPAIKHLRWLVEHVLCRPVASLSRPEREIVSEGRVRLAQRADRSTHLTTRRPSLVRVRRCLGQIVDGVLDRRSVRYPLHGPQWWLITPSNGCSIVTRFAFLDALVLATGRLLRDLQGRWRRCEHHGADRCDQIIVVQGRRRRCREHQRAKRLRDLKKAQKSFRQRRRQGIPTEPVWSRRLYRDRDGNVVGGSLGDLEALQKADYAVLGDNRIRGENSASGGAPGARAAGSDYGTGAA
jgi:hypothetical protein